MEDTPHVGERVVVSIHRADRESDQRLAVAYRCLEARSLEPDREQDRPKRTTRSRLRQEALT